MTTNQNKSYLITGANRGIGLNIVKILAQKKNVIIFAGARDPSKAVELREISQNFPNVHLVKIESANVEDAQAAAKFIEEVEISAKFSGKNSLIYFQVSGGLDYVIANAGISTDGGRAPVLRLNKADLDEHHRVNTYGPLVLFQQLHHLMVKRSQSFFVGISTISGSLNLQLTIPIPTSAYGTSKASLNLLTRKISQEHKEEGIVAVVLHPGSEWRSCQYDTCQSDT